MGIFSEELRILNPIQICNKKQTEHRHFTMSGLLLYILLYNKIPVFCPVMIIKFQPVSSRCYTCRHLRHPGL